jgi:hypothetical protein
MVGCGLISHAHDGRLVDFPVFTLQLNNFVEVIKGEATPRVPLRDSVISACVIEALLASVASGSREFVQLITVCSDGI